MFDAQTYGLFLATATVLVLSPGPDTVLILSRTLASLAIQSVVLGTTLAVMAVAWIGLWVGLVGRFRTVVASNTAVLRGVSRLAAVTFVGLACRLAIETAAEGRSLS